MLEIFLRDLLENLKATAQENIEKVIQNSRKNHHAEGVNYINLLRSPELTIKLYLTFPGISHNSQGYIVNPHDHRYSFETYVLRGEIDNILFKVENSEDGEWERFEYSSHFTGGFSLEKSGSCDLKIRKVQKLKAGDFYALDAEAVHTIAVSQEEPTILLLFQHQSGKNQTKYYAPKGQKKPDTSSLYQRFTEEEVRFLLSLV